MTDMLVRLHAVAGLPCLKPYELMLLIDNVENLHKGVPQGHPKVKDIYS